MKKLLALSLLISLPAMAAEKPNPFAFWRKKEAEEKTVYQDQKSGSKITQKPDGCFDVTVGTSRPGFTETVNAQDNIDARIQLQRLQLGRGGGTKDAILGLQSAFEKISDTQIAEQDKKNAKDAAQRAKDEKKAAAAALKAQQAQAEQDRKAEEAQKRAVLKFQAQEQKRKDAQKKQAQKKQAEEEKAAKAVLAIIEKEEALKQQQAAALMEQDIQAQERRARAAAKFQAEEQKRKDTLAAEQKKQAQTAAEVPSWRHVNLKTGKVFVATGRTPSSFEFVQEPSITYHKKGVTFTTTQGATMLSGRTDEVILKARAMLQRNPHQETRLALETIIRKLETPDA